MKDLLIFSILLCVTAKVAFADSKEIVIKSESQVESENITLDAITTDSDSEFSHLILDASPARGKAVVWTAAEISKKLRPYQEILKDTRFRIPKRIKIMRVDQQINDVAIQKKITDMLQRLLPSSDWEVSLKSLQKIQWPDLSASAQIRVIPLNVRPKGAGQFEFVIEDQGKTLNHVWVNGDVEYFAKVPVAQKPIVIRTSVKSDDISWEKRNVTYFNEIPATESDFATSVVKMFLPTGTVITKNLLDRELAVKFGEEVEVQAGTELFSVSTKAVAQQNAYVGDLIKLRTGASKFLTGTVTGLKKVQVGF